MCGMAIQICFFHPLLLFAMNGHEEHTNMLIKLLRLPCKLQRSSVLHTCLTAESNRAAPAVTAAHCEINKSISAAPCLLMQLPHHIVADGVYLPCGKVYQLHAVT